MRDCTPAKYTKKVEIELPHQIVTGPGGIRLHLEAGEIFLNDPGMGTPLLVEYKKETMTLECALGNSGEMGCGEVQQNWISDIYEQAGEWHNHHCDRIEREANALKSVPLEF